MFINKITQFNYFMQHTHTNYKKNIFQNQENNFRLGVNDTFGILLIYLKFQKQNYIKFEFQTQTIRTIFQCSKNFTELSQTILIKF